MHPAAVIILSLLMQLLPQENIVEALASRISASRVEFGYEYVMDDGRMKMTGSGSVNMQGACFKMEGDGLEVFCDGISRWTVDRNAREVVIESFDSVNMDYLANPAMLVSSFDKAFKVSGQVCRASYSGKACVKAVLKPVASAGMDEVILYITEDGNSIAGAEILMSDGAKAIFTLPYFRLSGQGDASCFRFDVSSLSSDYIVTDLR